MARQLGCVPTIYADKICTGNLQLPKPVEVSVSTDQPQPFVLEGITRCVCGRKIPECLSDSAWLRLRLMTELGSIS